MTRDAATGPVVIAAGGTGGHVFPAQALAQEMMRRGRSVALVTDPRGERLAEAFRGASLHCVSSATFADRGAIGKIAAMGAIVKGAAEAVMLFRRLKPAVVVGFGGYPALPGTLAGFFTGTPVLAHEQNAVLGRVNRALAARFHAIAVAFPEIQRVPEAVRPKLVMTGNPVRPAAVARAGAAYEPPAADGPIRLLVFGGSQGARILTEVVPAALAQLDPHTRARLVVTQQCRPEDLDTAQAAYAAAGICAELQAFFQDMPERIAAAHLVIARAGASTCAELTAIGRPAILVPYPFAMDDHQRFNAASLAGAGAVWSILQTDFDATSLAGRLTGLLKRPEELARAAGAARAIGRPDAVVRLADLVERIGGPGGAAARAALRFEGGRS